ncbi:helix-turn-helix domain-containing protein [Bacteroidota bacterium]
MEIISFETSAFKKIMCTIEEIKNVVNELPKITPEFQINMIEKTWLTKLEVCKILQISDRTLQKYRKQKIIPFSRVSNKIYYRASDVRAHLMNHYHQKKN